MNIKIGLEIHVHLGEDLKFFSNNAHSKEIDRGAPGCMPTVDRALIQKAMEACYLLNCNISNSVSFDRKIYVYHDLPLNYQITQKNNPIGRNGSLDNIPISTIHMESDAAATTYDEMRNPIISTDRLNTLLIEITTPAIDLNEEQIIGFIKAIQILLCTNNISDCSFAKGNIRYDINLSDSEGCYRAEFKNVNGINVFKQCCAWYRKNYLKFPYTGPGMTVNVNDGMFRISRRKVKYCFVREPDIGEFGIDPYPILNKKYNYFERDDQTYNIVSTKSKHAIEILTWYISFNKDIRFLEVVNLRNDLLLSTQVMLYKIWADGFLLKKHISSISSEYIINFDRSKEITESFMNAELQEIFQLDPEKQIINFNKIIHAKKSK